MRGVCHFPTLNQTALGGRPIPDTHLQVLRMPVGYSISYCFPACLFDCVASCRYERVREMLTGAGLSLPDSPRIQAGGAATLAPVGTVDSSEVDPGALRVCCWCVVT